MKHILAFALLTYCAVCSYAQDVCAEGGVCECTKGEGGLTVDCSGRSLSSVPAGIPNDTHILNLNNNDLRHIPEDAFANLQNLLHLNMNNNHIHRNSLTGALLGPLVRLQALSLTDNRLQILDESLYSVFSRLELVELGNNIFVCNCDMLWLRNWLLNKIPSDLPTVTNAKCNSPANTANLDITVAEFCLQNPSCYTCSGASSNAECNQQGISECSDSETSCQNEIRIINGVYSITKMCQGLSTCVFESYNNYAYCDEDGQTSVCRYCCQGSQCNGLERAYGVEDPTTTPPVIVTSPSSICEFPGDNSTAVNCTFLHVFCNHTTNDLIGLNCTDGFGDTDNQYGSGSGTGNNGGDGNDDDGDSSEDETDVTEGTTQRPSTRGPSTRRPSTQHPSQYPTTQTVVTTVPITTNRATSLPLQTIAPTNASVTRTVPITTNRATSLPLETTAPTNASVTHAQNYTTVFQNGTGSSTTASYPMAVPTCPEETLTDLKGTFVWPETEGDTSRLLECPYNPGNFSVRKCVIIPETGALEWGDMVTTKCAYENMLTRELQALASTEVTAENAMVLSTMLGDMTSSAENFTPTDVDLVVSVMENLAQNIAIYENSSRQVMDSVMGTASQMAEGVDEQVLFDGEEDSQSSTRILQNIDLFARDVVINETTFGVSTMTFDVAVLDFDTTLEEDVVFVGGTDSQADIFVNTSSDNLAADDLTSITMPASLFDLEIGPIWRCQFVLFTDTVYFDVIGQVVDTTMNITDQPIINNSTNSTEVQDFSNETTPEPIRTNVLNSLVVSATIGDRERTGLLVPIAVTLVHKQIENVGNPKCVFWNFTANGGIGGWSSDGCYVDSSNDTSTICKCNHLTNFALLMDIYGDTAELPTQHQQALSYISYIGCGLSILGLALTLLTYACCSLHYPKGDPRRRTKADKRVKILLNLVLSLLMANMFFMMASLTVEFEELEDVCRIMAVFLHYFLLSTMTWMALEAFNMYLSLVKVFERYYSHFLLKQMIFGWCVPLLFVIVTLSIDTDHYGFYSGACWLDRTAFYWSFMAPAVVILIFNFVVFTMVMKQLCNLRHTKITKTERFTAWSHLRGSVSLMVLLGLTWALAIFAVSEASLFFSYLFAILNSFQGLCIFIFHCLAKKDIRHHWRKLCCPCCGGPEDEFSSAYGSSSKYRSGTKRQRITWSTDARKQSSKNVGPSTKPNGSTHSNNTNSHTVSDYNSKSSYAGTNGTVVNRPPSHGTRIL